MKENIKNLIQKAKEVTMVGLPFMEGRTNGTLENGEIVTINQIGYLESEDGEYVVFTTKEDETKFYYGGSVVTEKIKELEKVLTVAEMQELLDNGIETLFEKKKSKSTKREFTTCTFFPN